MTQNQKTIAELKDKALRILGEKRMLTKRRVDLTRLMALYDYNQDVFNKIVPRRVGAVGKNDDEMWILTNDRLSPVEEKFEQATLLCHAITEDLYYYVRNGRQVQHLIGEDEDLWEQDRLMAMFLLYPVVPARDLVILSDENPTLRASKIARKRGIPTEYVLKRLAYEQNEKDRIAELVDIIR